jgi:hypothetical protein
MPPKKENKSAETLLKDMAHDVWPSVRSIAERRSQLIFLQSRIRTTEKSKNLMDDYEADLEDIEDKTDAKVAENKKAL